MANFLPMAYTLLKLMSVILVVLPSIVNGNALRSDCNVPNSSNVNASGALQNAAGLFTPNYCGEFYTSFNANWTNSTWMPLTSQCETLTCICTNNVTNVCTDDYYCMSPNNPVVIFDKTLSIKFRYIVVASDHDETVVIDGVNITYVNWTNASPDPKRRICTNVDGPLLDDNELEMDVFEHASPEMFNTCGDSTTSPPLSNISAYCAESPQITCTTWDDFSKDRLKNALQYSQLYYDWYTAMLWSGLPATVDNFLNQLQYSSAELCTTNQPYPVCKQFTQANNSEYAFITNTSKVMQGRILTFTDVSNVLGFNSGVFTSLNNVEYWDGGVQTLIKFHITNMQLFPYSVQMFSASNTSSCIPNNANNLQFVTTTSATTTSATMTSATMTSATTTSIETTPYTTSITSSNNIIPIDSNFYEEDLKNAAGLFTPNFNISAKLFANPFNQTWLDVYWAPLRHECAQYECMCTDGITSVCSENFECIIISNPVMIWNSSLPVFPRMVVSSDNVNETIIIGNGMTIKYVDWDGYANPLRRICTDTGGVLLEGSEIEMILWQSAIPSMINTCGDFPETTTNQTLLDMYCAMDDILCKPTIEFVQTFESTLVSTLNISNITSPYLNYSNAELCTYMQPSTTCMSLTDNDYAVVRNKFLPGHLRMMTLFNVSAEIPDETKRSLHNVNLGDFNDYIIVRLQFQGLAVSLDHNNINDAEDDICDPPTPPAPSKFPTFEPTHQPSVQKTLELDRPLFISIPAIVFVFSLGIIGGCIIYKSKHDMHVNQENITK